MDDAAISYQINDEENGVTGVRTLSSAIHRQLRNDIIHGRYPPNEKLLIAPLAKRFQVSLSSVREALLRLVADGLVISTEQRGFKVSPLLIDDMKDVTRIRCELECLALRRSIASGGPEWGTRLSEAWEDLRSKQGLDIFEETWGAAHARFHFTLVSACGLDWLLRFIVTLFEQSERYRAFVPIDFGERDVYAEHLRIFEAAISRNTVLATKELRKHYEISTKRFYDYLLTTETSGNRSGQ